MASLRESFETFIQTVDQFESIDDLLKHADPHGKQRADYLLCGRKIIIEQKVLEVDPGDKPSKFMNNIMKQRNIIAYGRISSEVIFRKMHDGDRLRRSLTLYTSKVIDDIVAKADKQTRDTREIFSIPDAVGILILLNEKAIILNQDIIRYSLSQVFQKISDDGSLRYPHNNGVILISSVHFKKTAIGMAFPCHFFTSPHQIGATLVRQFSDMLFQAWAKFNGIPLFSHP